MEYNEILDRLASSGNLRKLTTLNHSGKYVFREFHDNEDGILSSARMLNLSSNDYLGIASDGLFLEEFIDEISSWSRGDYIQNYLFSSSSSRLLTGNFSVYDALEERIAAVYGREASLVTGSGYAMNSGILPAVADSSDVILADKLVHASIIDGLRLGVAKVVRYRHQDLDQLDSLVSKYSKECSRIFIVTESIFSMDGDVTDLQRLVSIKKSNQGVMLYLDEAHAVGVCGENGLGCAEEFGCIGDIDFLCGTFGKALASVGAFVLCSKEMKSFLINRMRPLIFTTALPPVNVLWTLKIINELPGLSARREHLKSLVQLFPGAQSQIVPVMIGDSAKAVACAEDMQRKGFYLLPVRPPTVPEGTSRLRLSLTSSLETDEVSALKSELGL